MANNPVMGMQTCPHCNKDTPVFWNGNINNKCVHCGKIFKVKRQKLKKVQRLRRTEFDD